jgi:hypothetical protein
MPTPISTFSMQKVISGAPMQRQIFDVRMPIHKPDSEVR